MLQVRVCPFCSSQEFAEGPEFEIGQMDPDSGRQTLAKSIQCANERCVSRKEFRDHYVLILVVPGSV